jgi:hypothetical protein
MDLARHIHVERRGTQTRVLVDGDEFPWRLDRSAVSVYVDAENMPSLTITIVAQSLTVDDTPVPAGTDR